MKVEIWLVLCVVFTPAEFITVTSETTPAEEQPKEDKTLSIPTAKCADIKTNDTKTENESCIAHCKKLNKQFDGECKTGVCNCKLDLSELLSVKERPRTPKPRKGIKCKNLIRFGSQDGSENHRGCGIHCRLANPENKDGMCVQGVCQCTREVIERTTTTAPEDEEFDGVCEEGTCASECSKSDKNTEGYCLDGECRCRDIQTTTTTARPTSTLPPEISGREEVNCVHRKKTVSDEICRSHCEEFSRDHPEGHCVDGVCRCGYAVFEIMESETEKPVEKGNRQRGDRRRKVQRKRPRKTTL